MNKTSSLNQGSNLENPPTVDDSKAYAEVCTWQCACVDGVGHRRDSDLHSVDEMNHNPSHWLQIFNSADSQCRAGESHSSLRDLP